MGLADALANPGIPYDSEAAILLVGDVMRRMAEQATASSTGIAETRGSYPNFGQRRMRGTKGTGPTTPGTLAARALRCSAAGRPAIRRASGHRDCAGRSQDEIRFRTVESVLKHIEAIEQRIAERAQPIDPSCVVAEYRNGPLRVTGPLSHPATRVVIHAA